MLYKVIGKKGWMMDCTALVAAHHNIVGELHEGCKEVEEVSEFMHKLTFGRCDETTITERWKAQKTKGSNCI